MHSLDKLRASLERLAAGTATEIDRQILQQALQAREINLAAGDRSVAIGGDATNTTVITGDGAVLISFEGAEATIIQHALSSLFKTYSGSAPPRPALLIGREIALKEIKSRLGIDSNNQSHSSLQVITAVRGWPGVGKTTFAAALAHDADVASAFPDGVLWTSLGRSPSIFSELTAWGRSLGLSDLTNSSDIQEVSAHLSAFLREKRVLIIVDDVWEPEHAIPFKVGGRGCAMIITTRENSVAQAIAPTANDIYKLPVLSHESALYLLSKLAPNVVTEYPQESLELVQELEGLPLALQVAGHLLYAEANIGWGVMDLLNELRTGVKLLEAKAPADLADIANETTPTVAVLLQKSTDRLDEETLDCFAYLGVFAPEPATFDLAAMEAVWQVPNPKPIVHTLVDRGLLEPVGFGRFQMHALLTKHARSFLTE
jgi:hypothetical protein